MAKAKSKRPKKAKASGKRRVTLTDEEKAVHQKIQDAAKTKAARMAKAREFAELAEQARQGDFSAYLRLNGYPVAGGEALEHHLENGKADQEIDAALSSDLICQSCGKYHLQNTRKVLAGNPAPITCPHCHHPDCAGPRRKVINGMRGLSKSEKSFHNVAFRIGLAVYRDESCEWIAIGANRDEAYERIDSIWTIMERPAHLAIFGSAAVPLLSSSKSTIRLPKRRRPVLRGYGIMGVPPGHHVDGILLDDVVNMNNTMVNPSMIDKVKGKYTEVISKFYRPGGTTVIIFIGTPWRPTDLNAMLRTHAKRNPDTWIYWEKWAGGPEDNFVSPIPNRMSPRDLREDWELDARAYERGMMGKEIGDDEIAFREPSYWVNTAARRPPMTETMMKAIQGFPQMAGDGTVMASGEWEKIIALDAGFTGAEGQTKGRSKTGLVVLAYHFPTSTIWVLYAREEFWAPEEVKPFVCDIAQQFGTKKLVMEIGGELVETVTAYRDLGFEVFTYNPTRMGSKVMRKFPVAEDWNNGQILLRGYPTFVGSGKDRIELRPVSRQSDLREAAMAFPAETRDILDALEIGVRELWKQYGRGTPLLPQVEAGADFATRVMQQRALVMHDATHPAEEVPANVEDEDRETDIEELDEYFPAVAGSDLDGVFESRFS